jgi:hypothetical protein
MLGISVLAVISNVGRAGTSLLSSIGVGSEKMTAGVMMDSAGSLVANKKIGPCV